MTKYRLSMSTRVIRLEGTAHVEVGHISNAAAWATLTEQLEALGITVSEVEPEAEQAGAPLQPIAPEWLDAVNSAKGLCDSEANRWEHAQPGTSQHWRSVAIRLGALWLAGECVGVKAEQAGALLCKGIIYLTPLTP